MEFAVTRFLRRLRLTLEMIKFEHSVFALPFALTGALLAWSDEGFAREGAWTTLLYIVIAMVAARSVAMAFNRVLDAEIDGRNPRTKMRHLPAGLLSKTFAWGFIAFWVFAFLFAAKALNPLCLKLAPAALLVVMFYSYTKRFTLFAHLVLGFCLGIAPAAAWIAVRGSLDPRILWLTLSVTLWTAGFDIIYACQDYTFDVHSGLFSIPSRFGIAASLWISRVFHLGMLASLLMLVHAFALGSLAFVGIAAVAGLLVWEHRLVKADDLSRVDAAFFTMNGYVSVIFFLFWASDIFLHRYMTRLTPQ
jgi:4-hydroxybenzoate polyprenyltransferase